MGSFYVNFTVKGPSTDRVVEAVNGRTCYVYDAPGDVTLVTEQTSDETFNEVEKFCTELSKSLACPVLSVLNHDDDVLYCLLLVDGQLRGFYESAPGIFDGQTTPPRDEMSKELAAAFNCTDPEQLAAVLNSTDYLFAFKRHAALFSVLGLPAESVFFGFRYSENGEFPEGMDEQKVICTN